jgi:tRNA pseudouridine13 synthase
MKLKQRPEDFHVEELTDVEAGQAGEFAYYRLEKHGLTTPDAIAAIQRRWKLDPRRISFGGLKDRHAHTIQYLTIHRGPARNLNQDGLGLTYLGRIARPYGSEDIRANRFRITLRDLGPDGMSRIESALPELASVGVPNYFDDQRFGSVAGTAFIAREMVLGNFETALRLALVAPYEFDRPRERREKAVLAARWGDWPAARGELPDGHARQIVGYLTQHPTDFRGACALLRPELQGLYLAAWQSHLWNRMLARWLTDHVPAGQLARLRLKAGDVVMPRSLPVERAGEWDTLIIPLPSARLKVDPQAPWASVVEAVMAQEGIPLAEMRIKGMRRPFFSKGERAAKVAVANLTSTPGDDEAHAGRRKVTLAFELPRGCYATMVVKRLTA